MGKRERRSMREIPEISLNEDSSIREIDADSPKKIFGHELIPCSEESSQEASPTIYRTCESIGHFKRLSTRKMNRFLKNSKLKNQK